MDVGTGETCAPRGLFDSTGGNYAMTVYEVDGVPIPDPEPEPEPEPEPTDDYTVVGCTADDPEDRVRYNELDTTVEVLCWQWGGGLPNMQPRGRWRWR